MLRLAAFIYPVIVTLLMTGTAVYAEQATASGYRQSYRLACSAVRSGDNAAALELFRKALEASRIEGAATETEALRNLGDQCVRSGRYKDARKFYLECLRGQESIYGPNHQRLDPVLAKLADLMVRTGDSDGAERIFKRLESSRARVFSTHHKEYLTNWLNLYNALIKNGKQQEASALVRTLLVSIEKHVEFRK